MMVNLCRRLSESCPFKNFILAVIVFTAILMGVETNLDLYAQHKGLFTILNGTVQTIFILELTIRLIGFGRRPWLFFRDGWNVFDFVVVAASLLPAAGPFAMVARMARLLRLARLVSAVPQLRLIVETMLRTLPSLGYIMLLLGMILYVYAILGFHLFHAHDPERWGSISLGLLTLFEILTLEGWVDIQNTSMEIIPNAWLFYVSFIVLAVFIVVNLFIAVVINNLEAAREEMQAAEAKARGESEIHARVKALRDDLDGLVKELERRGRR